MSKKEIKPSKAAFDALYESDGLSRRDALKLLGIGGAATMMGAPIGLYAEEPKASSDKEAQIVIVGGGSGGIMAAARLKRAASNAKITLIAPNEIHLYQPGQVFMAAGLLEESDIQKPNSDFIPSGVTWIKDEVTVFDPDNNKVTTSKNGDINYDFLVVATGIQYDYKAIEGMSEELVGQKGISSVYLSNFIEGTAKGGTATWQWFQDVRAAAQKANPKNPIKVIFTQPDTPIKCGGAPQKILYLNDDYLRGNGPGGGEDVHMNAKFTFCKKGKGLFSLPSYNKTLLEEVTPMYGNIDDKWDHILRKIDPDKKIATFEHAYEIQGVFDKDIGEYNMIQKTEMVDMPYDFIHVVPPMKPVDAVANSLLGWQKGTAKGWLECDQYTLQHKRYKNVFGIGDILGIPIGKTGGSARHHGPVLVENLIATMEGKALTAKFDGYTVCPLKTQYGKIVLAEFNYDGEAPSFPLDASRPRWIWWAFDLYMLKPMYWYLMLRGLM
ncbi:MAG: FAD/NAD(P)-binding oxidoreductase [Sulfurovaceae bacterium]|nr:FAD/NAD(P)-binding oxidoreductase [Sulfurovaceae bacterium]